MRTRRTRGWESRGFTLIELLMVVTIIALIAALAIPNLMASRKHADEGSAIASLREISLSETIFRESDKEKDGNIDYGMLSELTAQNLIDPIIGGGTKAGYLFQATYSFTSSEFLWFGVANPVIANQTGDRGFVVNNTGAIFFTTALNLQLDTASCQIPASARPVN